MNKDNSISKCFGNAAAEHSRTAEPPQKPVRTALVTGAASGIGRAVILRLAADGFRVVGCSRRSADHESAATLGRELDALGADWRYVSADISDGEGRKKTVDTVYEEFGRLDVLVNCAGVAPEKRVDILELTPDAFDRLLNINLRGTFFLTQYAANRMAADTPPGMPRAVITVTSISAETVSFNRAEYCISKAGLSMASRLFAARLAEYGINVYELRPGIIDTDMIAPVRERYDRLLSDGLAPLGRMGKPEDIADAVSALAAGALCYATGEIINLDGGMHISRL